MPATHTLHLLPRLPLPAHAVCRGELTPLPVPPRTNVVAPGAACAYLLPPTPHCMPGGYRCWFTRYHLPFPTHRLHCLPAATYTCYPHCCHHTLHTHFCYTTYLTAHAFTCSTHRVSTCVATLRCGYLTHIPHLRTPLPQRPYYLRLFLPTHHTYHTYAPHTAFFHLPTPPTLHDIFSVLFVLSSVTFIALLLYSGGIYRFVTCVVLQAIRGYTTGKTAPQHHARAPRVP